MNLTFKQYLLLILFATAVVSAAYYIFSPYHDCMRKAAFNLEDYPDEGAQDYKLKNKLKILSMRCLGNEASSLDLIF